MVDKAGRDGTTRVLELFEEGRRFNEDLLKENERLRAQNAQLRGEGRESESLQREITLLEEEVRALRAEKAELHNQFLVVEEENREFADRYLQVERQNSNLANLYVASYRLHSTLEYGEVIAIIKEIVVNMIGSETFGIYALDEGGRRLVLIGQEGMDGRAAESVPLEEGELGRCACSGELFVTPEEAKLHEQGEQPVTCIPLKVGDRVLGVIGIYQLLRQKEAFRSVDFDLFELLGGHAATAIYVAKLNAASERKRNGREGALDLLKTT